MFRQFSSNKSYYQVLQIDNKASSKEIKSAYLSLAKNYHPDMPTGNSEKFKAVSQAYEVLGNKRLKAEYD